MSITGQRGGFLQPGKWGRNESGNYDTWTFESTNKADIYAMAARVAQTLGLAYDVTESFGKFKLDVYFPWNTRGIDPRTDLVVKWEFFAQHVEKDLLAARVENQSTIAQLSTSQVQQLRNFLINPPDGIITPFPTAATFEQSDETNGAVALSVFQLMMQGVTSYPTFAPQLRRTFTTSNQYAIAYALIDVGRVISTDSLVSIESIPPGILFNLPNSSWSDPQADAPALAYGWLKSFPTVQQVALLKWNIVQEWDYGLWATLLYGNPL